MGQNCLGATGMRVMSEQCSTCIFRPGNLMHLNTGRLADMVSSVKATESYVICHDTLDLPLRKRAICKGSFDRIKTTIIQLAERMGFIELVDPERIAEIMSLHNQPTNYETVKDYLRAAVDVPEAELFAALGSDFASQAIARGRDIRSLAGYVADQIIDHFGWEEREDFDPDAEDDDDD